MQIYLTRDGRRFGPYTIAQINEKAAARQVLPDDLFWMEGWTDWRPITAVPGYQRPDSRSEPTDVYPPTMPGTGGFRRERIQAENTEHALRLFIGKKADYYLEQWRRERETGKTKANWAAFFFSLGWLSYRKMYRYSFILLGVIFLEGACDLFIDLPPALTTGVSIGIGVACAMNANRWYRLHVESEVRKITVREANQGTLHFRLEHEGGTSVGAALGFSLGALLLCFGLAALKIALA